MTGSFSILRGWPAQIVSGIGFIGGGVISVRKDLVCGVTTAARQLEDKRKELR
jgi:uncharacterized membrane protein YhiD involved in acid resistance